MIEEKYYVELSKHICFFDGTPYWNKYMGNHVTKYSIAGSLDTTGRRQIGITIDGKISLVLAHRLHWYMINKTLPKYLDHINRNPDDNRIENLRVCTQSQNMFNTTGVHKTSKYKGVHWRKDSNKWRASLRLNGKLISLGSFEIETEAAKAYNNAIIKYNLQEFAYLNKGV